jgi:hypothetical protein
MLSLKKEEKNKCIALLTDKKGKEQEIYIKETYDKTLPPQIDTSEEMKSKIFSEFLDMNKKLSGDEIKRLKSAYASDSEVDVPKLRVLLKDGRRFVQDSLKYYLSFSDQIDVLPYFKNDDAYAVYLSGASGSGKSFLISTLISKHLPPRDAGVFYLGPFANDPSFKAIHKHLIPVDLDQFRREEKRDIEIDDFPEGSVVIFDDIESLPNAKQVESLRDRVLSVFRHRSLKLYCVNHVGMAGSKTKKLLLECKYVVVYPSSNWKQVETLLKVYMGLDKEKLSLIKNQPSRWVLCCKAFPSYFVTQHSVGILN